MNFESGKNFKRLWRKKRVSLSNKKGRVRSLASLVFGLGMWLVPLPVDAEDATIIRCDLASCIHRAFATHPVLKASRTRQSAALARVDMQKAQYYPDLSVGGGLGFLAGEPTTPFRAVSGGIAEEELIRSLRASGGFYQANVGLNLPIVENGAVLGHAASNVRGATFDLSEEKWKGHALETQIALSVAEAYIGLLKDRKAVQLYETIVLFLETVHGETKARFLQGMVSKEDLLKSEVRMAKIKRDLASSRYRHTHWRNVLVVLTGLDKGVQLEIEDFADVPEPLPSYEQLVAQARTNHPDVKASEFKVLSSLEKAVAVQGEKYPALSLKADFSIVDDFRLDVANLWTTQLRMEWHVFDLWLLTKKGAVARAQVVEEENRLLESRYAVEQKVDDLYYQIQAQDAEIEFLTKQMALMQDALALARTKFKEGLLSEHEVSLAEVELREHQLAVVNAAYDRRLTDFQLRVVSGEARLPERGQVPNVTQPMPSAGR